MRNFRAIPHFVIVIVLSVLSLACTPNSAPSTPATPTPPQLKAASAINALAQSLDAAITTMQAARSQGKLSAADVANAEKVAAIIATTGKQIDAELKSADAWPNQRTRILQIIATSGLEGTIKTLPQSAAPYLTAAIALFNQASQAVGGPIL